MLKFAFRNSSFLPREVVIVAAKRTPIGSFMGVLSTVPAPHLASCAIKAALAQAKVQPSAVQELILGNVYTAGLGQAPARQACVQSGLPESTICLGVNKVCSSGIKSITLAASDIALGLADVVMAGGMENMSLCPFLLPNYRSGQLMGDSTVIDSLTYDGLFCPFNKVLMGSCAEKTNLKYGITREMQDEYCVASYKRASDAWARGFFKAEVAPVDVQLKKDTKTVAEDEEFKKVKLDKIPTLKPVFEKNGTITPANASSINDGACAVLLMSAEKAKAMGVKPLARVLAFADHETEPVHFSVAPAGSIPVALERAGLSAGQIDLFEINEAFSSVAVVNMKMLELEHSKVNVNGGAVALGHPVGMSGARIISTLIYGLKDQGKTLGVAGICNGGGGATSLVLENLN